MSKIFFYHNDRSYDYLSNLSHVPIIVYVGGKKYDLRCTEAGKFYN